jgi:hypothetical protein
MLAGESDDCSLVAVINSCENITAVGGSKYGLKRIPVMIHLPRQKKAKIAKIAK